MKNNLNDYQNYLIEEFAEQYLVREMGRRDLLKRVLAVTGSIPLAASALVVFGCSGGSSTPAPTATPAPPTPIPTPVGPGVQANDPAIQGSDVKYPGPASEMLGYLARPNKAGQFPGIIIIHENQGLQEHFKDVARRYAKEGFVGLAVDMVSRLGGTKEDPAVNAAAARADYKDVAADLLAAVDYLKRQTFVKSGGLGATGFCLGGGYVWELAVASPDIKAAVPYYGPVRSDLPTQMDKINAAVLALFGDKDNFTVRQIPDMEQAMRAAGKTLETKVYPGAGHAFFNDTRPAAQPGGVGYNAEAATAAWPATLAWFRKYLSA